MDTPNQGSGLSKKQERRLERQQIKQTQHAGQTTKRTGKRIVFWLVILAIIGFFVYAIGKLATSTPDISGLPTDIAITAADHTLGNPEAKVELIEYADFQCPGCGAVHPVIKQLMTDYGDKVSYAYRHFPLPQHAHAKPMARAAEAAGKQNKFFEMHDLIFQSQSQWTDSINVEKTINTFANQLKLNIDQFETDMNSSEIKNVVDASYSGGVSYGVNSTPTFFMNGSKINLPRGLTEFKALIDQALITTANATTPAPATTQ